MTKQETDKINRVQKLLSSPVSWWYFLTISFFITSTVCSIFAFMAITHLENPHWGAVERSEFSKMQDNFIELKGEIKLLKFRLDQKKKEGEK